MSRTLSSPRQQALREFIVAKREAAGLTQSQVAEKLDQHQSFVARLESGQRRIDVVELLDLAAAMGFEPAELIDHLLGVATTPRRLTSRSAKSKEVTKQRARDRSR